MDCAIVARVKISDDINQNVCVRPTASLDDAGWLADGEIWLGDGGNAGQSGVGERDVNDDGDGNGDEGCQGHVEDEAI